MRLSGNEIITVPFLSREIFGPEIVARLFGSRIDDSKKGGDIDLCLETSEELVPGMHYWRSLDEDNALEKINV